MNPRIPLLSVALSLVTGTLYAETFVVTRFDDPQPTVCTQESCSLREAAMAAQQNDPVGPIDRIELAAGVYTLVRGQLPIGPPGVEVIGAGSDLTEITSNAIVFENRLLTQRTLSLRGMRMRTTAGSVLFVNEGNRLLLDDVVIPAGGGSVGVSGGEGSEFLAEHSELSDTLRSQQDAGRFTIRNSRFLNLYLIGGGGSGVDVLVQHSVLDPSLDPSAVFPGRVTIRGTSRVTFEDTVLADGVYFTVDETASQITLRRILFSNNPQPLRGSDMASLIIEDSVFRDNPTRAIYAEGNSDWLISGSSFINNRVDGNAGGAIVVEDSARVRIENSTFSNNSFAAPAAAEGARGGAIGFRNSTGLHLILRHVTIVPPAFAPAGIVGSAIGGIGSGNIDISNSIVRGSCGMNSSVLQNNSGNIESPSDTCGLDPQFNSSGVPIAALALGTLGDYGGATPTYLPADNSLAVDSGSTPQCLDVDQRGFLRPAGLRCDVGSVETGAINDRIFEDGFE